MKRHLLSFSACLLQSHYASRGDGVPKSPRSSQRPAAHLCARCDDGLGDGEWCFQRRVSGKRLSEHLLLAHPMLCRLSFPPSLSASHKQRAPDQEGGIRDRVPGDSPDGLSRNGLPPSQGRRSRIQGLNHMPAWHGSKHARRFQRLPAAEGLTGAHRQSTHPGQASFRGEALADREGQVVLVRFWKPVVRNREEMLRSPMVGGLPMAGDHLQGFDHEKRKRVDIQGEGEEQEIGAVYGCEQGRLSWLRAQARLEGQRLRFPTLLFEVIQQVVSQDAGGAGTQGLGAADDEARPAHASGVRVAGEHIWRWHERLHRCTPGEGLLPLEQRLKHLAKAVGIIRAADHLGRVAGSVEIDRITPDHQLEESGIFSIELMLHSKSHYSRKAGIARDVMHFAVGGAKGGKDLCLTFSLLSSMRT